MSEYLPPPYTRFTDSHPAVASAYQALGQACHGAGPLDAPTRHLIKLGVAAATQAEGAVKSHVRQALDAGASEAEVTHALLLVLTTAGFPRTVAALEWAREVLTARQG